MAKLTKSQRVTVITDIASRLELDDWTTIDLILKQFSFPTSDRWSGDKSSYIIEMIGSAEDDDLVELAEHFGMEVGGQAKDAAPPDPPFWEEGKLKVFISHLSKEREQAANLKTCLSRYGMSSFVAHNDIHPTSEWQIEIESALATCELLIALIHPKFVESPWCDQEIGYALGRGVPVFTVRCGADPYGFISRFQAFNGNGKTETEVASDIFDAALTHKKIQSQMASIMVSMFTESGSFAAAKTRIGYLERLQVWDDSFSDRISKATKENDHIAGSWGVTERVKAIIKKWKKAAAA